MPRRLKKALVNRIRKAVLANKDKVYQEIAETKEMYDLMVKWSRNQPLTDREKKAIRTQLFDICKTIPALAIFVVPFGGVLLYILVKILPFDVLPTAFNEVVEIDFDEKDI